MKIETLLNKARENAKKQVWLDYLDICDWNEEKTKELIKRERENGEFVKFVESETIDNIYKLIRTIRNTALMSDEEKEAAIAEIHNCPEWERLEKKSCNDIRKSSCKIRKCIHEIINVKPTPEVTRVESEKKNEK